MREIAENFSPSDSAADLSILYEVTGYRADNENFEFWDNYRDFENPGEDKLVSKQTDKPDNECNDSESSKSSDSY